MAKKPKTLKIKMLTSMVSAVRGPVDVGEVVGLPSRWAESLIADGVAVRVPDVAAAPATSPGGLFKDGLPTADALRDALMGYEPYAAATRRLTELVRERGELEAEADQLEEKIRATRSRGNARVDAMIRGRDGADDVATRTNELHILQRKIALRAAAIAKLEGDLLTLRDEAFAPHMADAQAYWRNCQERKLALEGQLQAAEADIADLDTALAEAGLGNPFGSTALLSKMQAVTA